ncbi:hypothetical protein [Paucibacter sp. KBW04]|uniref:hypothetical protein n=1 Tax=Paucibacter sp. KBW04 TaxID=2153361 RepID=UPI0012DEB951|nr:hypothetical protein [Paucibacter sp. KBW04]
MVMTDEDRGVDQGFMMLGERRDGILKLVDVYENNPSGRGSHRLRQGRTRHTTGI